MPLAIFDLDNTLVDRDRAFGLWCQAFAVEHGLEPASSLPVLLAADGNPNREREDFALDVVATLTPWLQPAALVEWYWQTFPPLFEADSGVLDGLGALRRQGWTIGIATNGGANQHAKIAAAQLGPLVDVVCASAIEGVAKPDCRFLELVATRVGSTLTHADWMVGDAEIDILAGQNAGMRTIWLRRGCEWANPNFQPDVEVHDAAEAIAVILAD